MARPGARVKATAPGAGTRVALTGTPGVGKTTLARHAAAAGWTVVDLGALAKEHAAVVGRDEEDDADVVDVERLRGRLPPGAGPTLVDGHLSHLLGLDTVWILRCHPDPLRGRLEARGYTKRKVTENVEAEAMDLILQEAAATGARIVQRDATHRSAEELLASFTAAMAASEASLEDAAATGPDIEAVDWSDWLMEDRHGA